MVSSTKSRSRKTAKAAGERKDIPLKIEPRHRCQGTISVQQLSNGRWIASAEVNDSKLDRSLEIPLCLTSELTVATEEQAVAWAIGSVNRWLEKLGEEEQGSRHRAIRWHLTALLERICGKDCLLEAGLLPLDAIPESQEQAAAKESAAESWICDCGTAHSFLMPACAECGGKQSGEQLVTRLAADHQPGDKEPVKKKARKKSSTPKSQASPTQTEGESLREIPLKEIVPSPLNPRQSFDPESLRELGESIKSHSLLQPIVVYLVEGRKQPYELIAGERRWRAAQLVGLKQILARILTCTEQEAIELRVIENLKREDLNAIDEARGFAQMMERCGYTQRTLADRLSVSQGHIGNRVGLLKLPEAWQQRVITGEITATMARELAPWGNLPAFFEALDEWFADGDHDEIRRDWSDQITRQIPLKISRQLTGEFYDYEARCSVTVCLSKKDREREDLDLREVPHRWAGKPEQRAFNVELWDELQAAGLARRSKSASQALDKEDSDGKSKRSPAEEKRLREQQAKSWQKKLYRYKIGWLQRAIIARLDPCVEFDGKAELLIKLLLHFNKSHDALKQKTENISEVAWACVLKWLAGSFEGYQTSTTPGEFELLARELEIDFAKEYRVDQELLALAPKAKLQGWIKEWGLAGGYSEKRSELIAEMGDDVIGQKPAPMELLKVKPIQL